MSSSRQGFLRHANLPPGLFRRGLDPRPPFFGAGVRVTRVAGDCRDVDVTPKLGLLNRNDFGTQFGGSMFAMTDPFFALAMLQNPGPDYVVRDKTGSIRYPLPGRGDGFARFRLSEDAARRATARGGRHEPTFTVAIADRHGATVAEVEETLHIRRRKNAESTTAAPRKARGRRTKA